MVLTDYVCFVGSKLKSGCIRESSLKEKPLKSFILAAVAAVFFLVDLGSASAQSRHCHAKASRYADRHAGPAESAFVGGIGGAVVGAIIGGAIGGGKGAGRGALIGGGVGALSGTATGSAAWRDAYDRVYYRCMDRRGRRIPARPAAWSDDWLDYCASKYRSFNPRTGKYRTYSGEYRTCR